MTDPIVHVAALMFIVLVVSSFVDRVGIENIISGIVVALLTIGVIILVFISPGFAIALGAFSLFIFLCNSETFDKYLKNRKLNHQLPKPSKRA